MLDVDKLKDGTYYSDEGIVEKKDGKIRILPKDSTDEILEEEVEQEENNKKRFKFRWNKKASILVGILMVAIITEEATYGFAIKQIKGLWQKSDNDDLDGVLAGEVINTLPLDRNGVLSITVPIGVKPLEGQKQNAINNTFYYAPLNFDNYYINESSNNQVELIEVNGDPRDNDNVRYWTTTNNIEATGYVGVQSDYANFLEQYDSIKAAIASGSDTEYSIPLEKVDYEVPDLYKVPFGYELYCEDKSAYEYVKLAYIDYDEADQNKEYLVKIYQIPEKCLANFVVVTTSAYNILIKGDELKSQLVEVYEIYSQDKGNMGYEEPAYRSR